jgi:hypothetical protein
MCGMFGGALFLSLVSTDNAGTALIVDSGSTNAAGFRIAVQRSGQAEYTAIPRRYGARSDEESNTKRDRIPQALADRLYSDLHAAKPLSSLPEARCMKSASFGTTLVIEFGGEKTPDLNCGQGDNAKLQALTRDAKEIANLFSSK